MELIKKWLSGKRNYLVGAVLYKQFGSDGLLKKLFEGSRTDHTQQLLEEALSALLQKPKEVLQPAAKKGDADEMPKSEDPVLEALRNEWLLPYQKMNYLRHELDRYLDNTEDEIAKRKALCDQILELEQQCMKTWTKRDHYMKHGQLPEVKEFQKPIPRDPVELGKAIETAKRNIRRNKAAAEKHPDNPIYPQKAKQYEAELQDLLKTTHGQGTEKPE
jgi:hypothetical protein